jgi:hypothetical protein
MINRKEYPKPMTDIERPYETVADAFSDGLAGEPWTVRLADLWSDLVRVPDERHDQDRFLRILPVVPFLDDTTGSLQWD